MSGKCIQSKKIFLYAFFLAGFFAYHYASARIVIDEIMYDVSGSDAGAEWIEIHNEGKESVNFSKWKFSEGNSNHGLTAIKGGPVIIPGEYAVIVDDPDKFKIDWPDFPGMIFDSTFSLSNTGETLALKDSSLNLSDQVSYLSSWGANGDGKSLQHVDEKWGIGAPTPGATNMIQSDINAETDPSPVPASEEANEQEKISLKITSKNTSAAGEEIYFESAASNSSGSIITGGKYSWNFGDGNIEDILAEGSVSHAYLYPGDYVAVLDYFRDENSKVPDASARTIMNVTELKSTIEKSVPVIASSSKQKDSDKNSGYDGGNNSDFYNLQADVSKSFKKSAANIYMWLAALLGLIAVSIGAVFFLRKRKTADHHESDDIEIID